MSFDHRTVVSNQVHEPKHISDSTSGDAGKVITPLSGGTSELRNLTPAEVGLETYLLEWSVLENSTIISTQAAQDSDLYGGIITGVGAGDYVKIDSLNLPGGLVDEAFNMTFDATNYDIPITKTGYYRVGFWVNFASSVATTKVGFRLLVNGTPVGATAKRTLANADTVGHMSVSALSELTAGQDISIAVATDKAVDLTISDLKANLYFIAGN